MSPELVALVAAVAAAIARELLWWHERRLRQRGDLRTRDDDHNVSGNGHDE